MFHDESKAYGIHLRGLNISEEPGSSDRIFAKEFYGN